MIPVGELCVTGASVSGCAAGTNRPQPEQRTRSAPSQERTSCALPYATGTRPDHRHPRMCRRTRRHPVISSGRTTHSAQMMNAYRAIAMTDQKG